MFKNLRLWANILLGTGVAIVIAVTTLTLASLHQLDTVMMTAEQSQLRQYADIIKVNIRHETRLAETMSALVANMPDVQQHFADGDRTWLQAQFVPVYAALERDYGMVQFQFHTPPATSFLRLHKIEKFGDDLSRFRHSVVATNTQLKPQHGLEIGVADLGARGMVPVFAQDRHVGSVEFGVSFGPAFFADFKQSYGVEAGLHLMREGILSTFASTYGEQSLFDPATLQAAFNGTPQRLNRLLDGVPMAVYAEPIEDFSGTPIGVIVVAMDRRESLNALATTTRLAWLAGSLMMLIGLVIALVTARALTRRIRQVAAGIDQVAEGNLSGQIALDGRDELADLAQVVNRMRARLHDLVAQVELNSGAVDTAAREIARAVDSQAATSSEMSASVAEITSTMEELSASSSQIAEYSGSVVTIARRTYDDSIQGSEAMQQLVAKMEDIRHDNQHSLQEIVELGGKSKEISKIMQIIDTVADQTKLIAFNAALEASSAGEAGKRFGVVAAEIRRLADSVTESTGEIAKKVGEIQDAIGRLVITSEKGAVGIEQGMAASSRTAGFLQDLVQAASETTSSAQQISLSTQQQRTASSQVVVALREIVTASSDTAQSVRRISQVTQDMTQLSANLTAQVERFTLNDDSIVTKP